ncbi:Acyl-CoA synthase/ligase family protein [Desulfamplus magnetovallimortis]|uniref:Acyl-CoA synthase/ligase family protein n=1 Tax=Desulfamplus magnetovallimortis TaxID=1246637 RepID=A0A1W1H7Z7_9BACT|nr:fatty acid CoA ligase family protein [Desulfamplus magnetovallimortis]SLM28573.1 Acyl-CoA synthase/ligase family protein [Desulfamplus magnetovallimortis]
MTNNVNISHWLKKSCTRHPYKRAVVYPSSRDRYGRVLYSQITFAQLDAESDFLAHGLKEAGIKRGVRTILMVMPGIEFFCLTFAMFKVGAIPVVVDPGMGINRMLSCFRQSSPEAFIGIEKAHLLRVLRPATFKSIHTHVTVGKRWFWGGYTLEDLRKVTIEPFPVADTVENETAAILFTTGSTGPAKGVVYTHGNFDAQIRQIQSHFGIEEDEIDLPTFPLFALFDPALGMTAVIPDMDPTKPAFVNPERIIEAIENHGVTNMFASPALLNRVGAYGKELELRLPSLRRVVSAGAPVSPANIEQFSTMLNPDTEVHTPYGATEAVPVLSIASKEILGETRKLSEQGFGMCIGRPICDTSVELIKVNEEHIGKWSRDLLVADKDVGEITVKAPLVTKNYFQNPKAELFSKILDDEGGVWHRMGDLGWRDTRGRIWFCGRKSHRVITAQGTLFTIPCEAIFNNHDQVFRSALVGIGKPGNQIPVICIEPLPGVRHQKDFIAEMHELAASHPLTQDIEHILIHKSFPVDIRHNSKIFREILAEWAAKKLKNHITES